MIPSDQHLGGRLAMDVSLSNPDLWRNHMLMVRSMYESGKAPLSWNHQVGEERFTQRGISCIKNSLRTWWKRLEKQDSGGRKDTKDQFRTL